MPAIGLACIKHTKSSQKSEAEAKTLYRPSQEGGVFPRIGWQQSRAGSVVVSFGIGDETQLPVACASILVVVRDYYLRS